MRTAIVGIVIMAACGGGGSGGGPSIDDLATQVTAAGCQAEVECGDMPDTATCAAVSSSDTTEYETIVAEVKAGTVIYDSGAVTDCLNYLQDSCTFKGFHAANPCLAIFDGTLAAGAACLENEECKGYAEQTSSCVQTSTACDRGTSCCAGTCVAVVATGGAGAACTMSTECSSGLYCSTATSTCTALATTAGQTCTAIDGCADPMYCDLTTSTSGICTNPSSSGGQCEPTAALPCAESDEYCDAQSTLCTKKPVIGSACSPPSEGDPGVPCVGYANCDTTNHCVAVPTAGQACYTGSGTMCLGELTCVGSVCTAPAAPMVCTM